MADCSARRWQENVVTKRISKSIQEVSFTVSWLEATTDHVRCILMLSQMHLRASMLNADSVKPGPKLTHLQNGRRAFFSPACEFRRWFLAHSGRPRRGICVSSSSYLAAPSHICPDFLLLFTYSRLCLHLLFYLSTLLTRYGLDHDLKNIQKGRDLKL